MPSSAAARLAARLRDVSGGVPGVERAFAAELAWLRRGARSCPSNCTFAAEIRRRVRDDFAAERILRLDGWLLSRTELALCHAVSQPDSVPS